MMYTQKSRVTLIAARNDTYIVVGYDRAGNPLEATFREFDDGTLYVFHTMKVQKKWRGLYLGE